MNKQQLASKIWEAANILRSNIKANEYKDYILGFMFYKFVSDSEERYIVSQGGCINDLKECDEDTIDMIRSDIGYFIAYDNLFSVWKTKGVSLGASLVSEALSDFNRNINSNHMSVFSNIFSTLQNGLSKLGSSSGSRDRAVRDIIDLIDNIPTVNTTYDVLGYIYEYLIFKFSTAAKDDGAFYTPHEVSSLIARIIADANKNRKELKVYDPTCGSGSLLLNIGKEASKYIDKDKIKYYGQELITETYNLTRMNLVMKEILPGNIFIRNGNTLEDDWPYFDDSNAYELLRVDAVVSNPPYSLKWEPAARENDPRFKYGLAPSSKADYAFLLHCLYHLNDDGTMAIVLPHGVLFRGASEGEIRKNLVENNHIETIIGLPSNLFYATGIPTIIMVLKKNRSASDILFIDASQNFSKEKTQNVLRESDIQRIFDVVNDRKSVDKFSRLVSKSEIIENDYNLNIPRYISASPEPEKFNLYSLMDGSISDEELSSFNIFFDRFPALRDKLFKSAKGYNTFNDVDVNEIVLNDEKLKLFNIGFRNLTNKYSDYLTDKLIAHYDEIPSGIKEEITDELFKILGGEPLVDKYELYQCFADKWFSIENDLMMISESGLDVCKRTEPKLVLKKDSKTNKSYEMQAGWKGAVFPFELIQNIYFYNDFDLMRDIESEIDFCDSECSEIFDSFDEDVRRLVGKGEEDVETFDLKKVKSELKNGDYSDEVIDGFKKIIEMTDKKKVLNKQLKDIKISIDEKTKEKIESLTDDEIKDLLYAKWIKPIIDGMNSVCDNTINSFIKGLVFLREKYGDRLSDIDAEIDRTNKELVSMMDELTGSETDMLAIQMLKELLK